MKVLQTSSITLEYDQIKKRLVQTWKGFSTSETFRDAIDKTVEFTKANSVASILSDTLDQAAVKPEDTQYAASATPKLFMNGVKAMAFVMPKDAITKMSLNKFDKESKSDNIRFFSTIEEAQIWLDTKN